jgi:putative transcriptional regulator
MNFQKQLLISLPPLMDNNFQKSCVYLEHHDGDGAKGWIINKELDTRVSVRLRKSLQLGINAPIFYGGPVDINSAFVLHTPDIKLQSTLIVDDDLCVTRDKEFIRLLNSNTFPTKFRIVIGRCSWGAGQLESEMLGSRTNGRTLWTSCPYSVNFMWNIDPKEQWERGIENSATTKVQEYLKNF